MTFCAYNIKMIKLHQTLYLLSPSSLRAEWGMGWRRDRVSCLKIHYLNLLAGKKSKVYPFPAMHTGFLFWPDSANAGSILLLTPARMNLGVQYDTNIMTLSLEKLKQMLLSEEPTLTIVFLLGQLFYIFLPSFPLQLTHVPTGNYLQLIPQTQGTLMELLWGTKLNSRMFWVTAFYRQRDGSHSSPPFQSISSL